MTCLLSDVMSSHVELTVTSHVELAVTSHVELALLADFLAVVLTVGGHLLVVVVEPARFALAIVGELATAALGRQVAAVHDALGLGAVLQHALALRARVHHLCLVDLDVELDELTYVIAAGAVSQQCVYPFLLFGFLGHLKEAGSNVHKEGFLCIYVDLAVERVLQLLVQLVNRLLDLRYLAVEFVKGLEHLVQRGVGLNVGGLAVVPGRGAGDEAAAPGQVFGAVLVLVLAAVAVPLAGVVALAQALAVVLLAGGGP